MLPSTLAQDADGRENSHRARQFERVKLSPVLLVSPFPACARWGAILASFAAGWLPSPGRATPVNPAAPTPARSAALQAGAATAIHRALAADPASRVRLLGATLEANRLTLNFSSDLLDHDPGSPGFERFSRTVHLAAGEVLREDFRNFEVHTFIDGVPLDRLLAILDQAANRRPLTIVPLEPAPVTQALSLRRIAVSPGHGYTLTGSTWALQRSYWQGIVEDFVNHDMITLLRDALVTAGADVFPTRNLNRAAGSGESGFPRWQEAARYHIKALGADPSIWNEAGFTQADQDIRCRPRYANSINADILVSLHNNGAGSPGTGTGTETLYDTNNGFGPESKRLADAVHNRVIAAIRRDYNSGWTDRRVQGFNGNYGENRLATRPAILIEVAFMDRPSPDNAALQDEVFKRLIAQAIAEGIEDYFAGPASVAPAAPSTLIATAGPASIGLAWTDLAYNESGFRIERRTHPSAAWEPQATVGPNVTAYSDTTVAPGTTYVYRVSAFNAAGPSAPFTNEAAAAPAPTALLLASVTPATPPVRDWDQEVAFTLTVTDLAGRAVPGAAIAGQDGLRNLSLASLAAATDASGQYVYRSTVPAGQANATYSFTFTATKPGYLASAPVTRQAQVSHAEANPTGLPTLLAQPAAQGVAAGGTATFRIEAGGPAPLAYQWRYNDTDLPGATAAALTLTGVTTAQAGRYAAVVSNRAGGISSLAAPLTVTPAAWLANVSLRTALASAQTVTVGFVVAGGTRDLLVRAAGPTLGQFGLSSALADPRIELYRGATKVNENNDWPAALGPTMAALGAFPFATASRDAALLQSLDGAYTVLASGPTAGSILVEGYDTGSGSTGRLVNLSARNRVGTSSDLLIAGFYVAGTGTQRVLIRAVGPGLTPLGVTGVLVDPRLEVYEATGAKLAENDDWNAALASTFAAVGAFALPPASRDAALVLTLAAGRSYTAQVSGANGGTGEALVEVYELP